MLPYHTNYGCTAQEKQPEPGTALAFEALDKKAAAHFADKKYAIEKLASCRQLMGKAASKQAASFYRVKVEAWQLLADSHSALAHAKILLFFSSTAVKVKKDPIIYNFF